MLLGLQPIHLVHAVGAPEEPPDVGDVPGEWSISRLGYDSGILRSRGQESLTFRYKLPEGASQGTRLWYKARLSATVSVTEDRGGIVYVAAATNYRTAIQAKLDLRKSETRWSYLTIDSGNVSRTTTSRRFTLDISNYLQNKGVRAGDNSLVISLDSSLAPESVVDVTIDEATGLQLTSVPPYRLTTDVSISNGSIRPYEKLDVEYRVRRVHKEAGSAAHDVSLTIADKSGRPYSEKPRQIGTISDEARGVVTIGPFEPGQHRLLFLVDGREPFAQSRSELIVDVPASIRSSNTPWIIALAGVVVLILVVMVRKRLSRGAEA